MAVQLAKARGLYVLGTCSEANAEYVKEVRKSGVVVRASVRLVTTLAVAVMLGLVVAGMLVRWKEGHARGSAEALHPIHAMPACHS